MLTLNGLFISALTLVAVGAGVWGAYYQFSLKDTGMGETIVAREESPQELALSREIEESPVPSSSPQSPFIAQVQGVHDVQQPATPSPTPTAAVLPPSAPSPVPDLPVSESATIAFIDLPSQVKAGEKFTVRWRIDGPEGAAGENTTLAVVYNVDSHEGSSRSSVNSNTSTSFGSFTVPKTFSSTFTFGQHPGPVTVSVTAQVDGKTVRADRTITLTK